MDKTQNFSDVTKTYILGNKKLTAEEYEFYITIKNIKTAQKKYKEIQFSLRLLHQEIGQLSLTLDALRKTLNEKIKGGFDNE